MMKNACAQLNNYLLSKSEFTDLMGQKLFFIFAKENVAFPFATYRIENQEPESKDQDLYVFQLQFWFAETENVETIMDFLDEMKNIISDQYDWQSSSIDFVEEARSMAGIINFQCSASEFYIGSGDGNGGDNGGNNGGEVLNKTYLQLGTSFTDPFATNETIQSTSTQIRNDTSENILSYWLDNENYAISSGGSDVYIEGVDAVFEIGTVVRLTVNNEIMSSVFDGRYMANQVGSSGTYLIEGQNVPFRRSPSRTSPFNTVYPIGGSPFPFSLGSDSSQPIIIQITNGIVTEIIALPTTGFAYEE